MKKHAGAILFFSFVFASPITAAEPLHGRSERVVVHGSSLAGNLSGDSPDRHVSVYLPPGYDDNSGRDYPVLYLLHGFTRTDNQWFGREGEFYANLPEAADAAIASGSRGMIIVIPDAYTRYKGSMYSSSVVTGDWEAFVAEELVAYIDDHYRTIGQRRSRGLAGHSMGGYGTLRIGMKYPHVFSSLYAMNPCCLDGHLPPPREPLARAAVVSDDELEDAGFRVNAMLAAAAAWSPNPARPPRYLDLPVEKGELRPDVVSAWAANAPLAMAHQYIPELKRYRAIALEAGIDDVEDIAERVKQFGQLLTDYNIPHSTEIYDGDHTNRVQQRLSANVLPFFSANLSFENNVGSHEEN